MAKIAFESSPFEGHGGVLMRLPVEASEKLPSRGMSMIAGQLNGTDFEAPVEPDGEGSHWFRIKPSLLAKAGVAVGKTVKVVIEPLKVWPEPKVPDDLRQVLNGDPEAKAIWDSLTAAARWDWIRWMTAVRQAATRKKHVDSIPSRLRSGKRRPCCFDRSICTLTDA